MSIRKREWTTPSGDERVAWLVDYRDATGARRAKQFARKKEAEAFETKMRHEVATGVHTADSQSITVAAAAQNWIKRGEREGLEKSTLNAYNQHVDLHIVPRLGARRLNQLTKPMIEEYRDQLLDDGTSRAMAKRVLNSLRSIMKEAQRTGYVAQNVAQGVIVKRSGREKPQVVPPTKAEMAKLIEAARGARPMDLPFILLLIFGGLRASEIRALPWHNVDLAKGSVKIDQRADFTNTIGPPKSKSGFRSIPLPPLAVTELKKWKLRCPPSALDLVFPSAKGTPIFHANIKLGFVDPIQIAAGICEPTGETTKNGEPVLRGRYTLHDFRHACASLWIDQRVAPKRVQMWMGHHSIQVTFDTYGHLFAALEDDSEAVAAIEASLMGTA